GSGGTTCRGRSHSYLQRRAQRLELLSNTRQPGPWSSSHRPLPGFDGSYRTDKARDRRQADPEATHFRVVTGNEFASPARQRCRRRVSAYSALSKLKTDRVRDHVRFVPLEHSAAREFKIC